MSKLIIGLSITVATFFAGCSATSPALNSMDKKPEEIQKVIPLSLVTPEEDENTKFTIVFPKKGFIPIEDNYVNTRNGFIKIDKSPKVVIALPVESRRSMSSAETLNKTDAFKTEGYINESESNVEKEFMRFGFSLVDRSKFEAKLRTVRDSGKKDSGSSFYFDEKIRLLKKQFDTKKISESDYLKQINRLEQEKDTNRRAASQKEIVDMSELIRAAQSKGVQADYILQLNKIEEYQGYPLSISIIDNPQLQRYLKKNPTIQYNTTKSTLPTEFTIKVFQVRFSAKLINVQNGKVVWTGEHELNSLDIEDIELVFSILKKDISSADMNKKIQDENQKIQDEYDSAVVNYNQLEKLYATTSKKREYDDSSKQIATEKSLRSSIQKNENELKSINTQIKEFNDLSKNFEFQPEFYYEISNLTIKPNLTVGNYVSQYEKREIQKHREKLLNITIRSLIETIKTK